MGYDWAMTWILTALGALLVLVALRDIFRTLWHPRGFGPVGRAIFHLIWSLMRRTPRLRRSELAGPLATVVTAVAWTGLVVLGFALVYLPRLPEGFSMDPSRPSDLLSAIYLSMVAVATLGLGDVLPTDGLLQVLVPAEALVGFVLFTPVISWVLQLCPALARRRSFARQLTTMRELDSAPVVERAAAVTHARPTARTTVTSSRPSPDGRTRHGPVPPSPRAGRC